MRLTVVLAAAAALAPASAHAFKGGRDFGKTAAAGGGGGLYFTGTPAQKKWTCAICHTGSQGKIRIALDDGAAGLLASGAYLPGQSYRLTVTLGGEHRGLGARRNTNGMAATILDGKNAPAGRFTMFDGNELLTGGHDAEVVTAGTVEGRTSWTFTWVAPPAGTGPVTLYVALVDADGAQDSPPDPGGQEVISDPLGDDVATGRITFGEKR